MILSGSSESHSRPPGHRAGTLPSGGYCFINNVAVAARLLQRFNSQSPSPTLTIIMEMGVSIIKSMYLSMRKAIILVHFHAHM
jgi:hypothetical protein